MKALSFSRAAIATALGVSVILAVGTFRNSSFWLLPDQRGDAFLRKGKFAEAAKAYTEPLRIGVAEYRGGEFEAAAKSFARVAGATGAFNQGDAYLMHGNYDAAIASFDRAIGFHPGWKDAEENKALAVARRDKIHARDKNDTTEPPEEKPDEIVFDQKGENKKGQPQELTGSKMSDDELRATWLRRVQTTPGDFLRAKFAYQATHVEHPKGKAP